MSPTRSMTTETRTSSGAHVDRAEQRRLMVYSVAKDGWVDLSQPLTSHLDRRLELTASRLRGRSPIPTWLEVLQCTMKLNQE